jgi:PST family polysaccharide transporter
MKNLGDISESQQNLSERTLGGVAWMTTGVGIQYIIQLIVLAVLARLLTPADFGIVTAATIVINFSRLFIEIGFGPAIIQKEQIDKSHIQTAFTLSIIFGMLFFILFYFLAPVIKDIFKIDELGNVIKAISFIFIWQGLGIVSEGLLSRNFKFQELAFIRIFSYTIGFGVIALILAYLDFNFWALIIGHIVQSIIYVMLVLIISKQNLKPGINLSALKELAYLGGGFSLSRIINYFALQGDKFIVGRFLGAQSLGLYGKAYELMILPTKLYDQTTSKVALSSLSKVQIQPLRLKKAYRKSIALSAFIGLPLTIFIVLMSPQIILVLLGPQWTSIIEPFYILSIGIYFRLGYRVTSSLILAKGLVYKFAITQLIYAISVIMGTLLMINYDLKGVSYAILFAIILNYIVLTIFGNIISKLSLKEFILAHKSGFFLGIFTFALIKIIIFLSASAVPLLLITLTVIIITPMYLLIFYKVNSDYFWDEDTLWFRSVVLQKFMSLKNRISM